MSKVLVIRKPDKTVHSVPLSNKSRLLAYNKNLPDTHKWTFEEMEEELASKLPFIDESFVSAAEAIIKVKDLEGTLAERQAVLDSKNEELETANAKLAELQKQLAETSSAKEKIALIKAAKSKEEVTNILGDDTRTTVVAAANDMIASFE